MGLDLYNMAVELIGEVPPSCQFVYCIVAIMLLGAEIMVLLSPLLLIRAIGGRK